jgi:short-subunit dehydrogenase
MILKDKVVVITGASHGLGKSMAQILSARGAKVVICSRRRDKLEEIAKETGIHYVVADVAKEADILRIAEETISRFGMIDIWINNAGVWLPKSPIEGVDIVKAHDMFEINVFGTVYGSRVALNQMKRQKSGMIVNIISTSALNGRPNAVMYSASKYAVRGFTEALREEVVGSNVKVVSVYPGGIKTLMYDEEKPAEYDSFMLPDYVAEKVIDNIEKSEPENELIIRRPVQAVKS